MKPQPQFQLTDEQQKDLRIALQAYFLDELDLEVGDLQTDLFVTFLNDHIAKFYYNLGVADAIKSIKDKADDLALLIKD